MMMDVILSCCSMFRLRGSFGSNCLFKLLALLIDRCGVFFSEETTKLSLLIDRCVVFFRRR